MQAVLRRLIGHYDQFRMELCNLPRQQLDVAAGDKGMDSKS